MRKSGLLLHITSLASKYGVGDLGPEAYGFADFLARSKQVLWQVLPLNPPAGYNPYDCLSAFAGNTLLISPELLYRDGLLTKKEIQDRSPFAQTQVEYTKVITLKKRLLNAAYQRSGNLRRRGDYERFCHENRGWLEDFALFIALREHFWPRLWRDWPVELRERWDRALSAVKTRFQDSINREMFCQYLFFSQWFALKQRCNQLGIEIIGDIPIYVAYDSADVWANPEIFKLNRYRAPLFIAGVPPDLFSRTGQLWGNPTYHWLALKKTNYSPGRDPLWDWWLERLRHNLTLFDRVRLDHFRGFFRYWRVPAGSKTAAKGKWAKGPGKKFFDVVFKRFPIQKVIAEDLGYITPDVKSFVKKSGLAGMRVLQFGFGGNPETNPHFLKNHIKNSVCYTGTHDNNTIVGWFTKEANKQQKNRLFECLGHKPKANEIHWELIRLALSSVSNLVIIPVQDILGLCENARMNRPASSKGNWKWLLEAKELTRQISGKLAGLTQSHDRA